MGKVKKTPVKVTADFYCFYLITVGLYMLFNRLFMSECIKKYLTLVSFIILQDEKQQKISSFFQV